MAARDASDTSLFPPLALTRRRLAAAAGREARRLAGVFLGPARRPPAAAARGCRVEPLEGRRLLSGVDIDIYGASTVGEGEFGGGHLPLYIDLWTTPYPGGSVDVTVDWGDGTTDILEDSVADAGPSIYDHYYLDGPAGPFAIKATASYESEVPDPNDPDAWVTLTETDEAEHEVTSENVEPTFQLVTDQPEVRTDETYALWVNEYVDPGQDAPVEWRVDWGDGTTDVYPGDRDWFEHEYDGPADTTYTVTATLTDDDGTYARTKTVKYRVPRVTVHQSDRVFENAGNALIHVERDVPTTQPVTVQLSRGGSAVLGQHFNDTGLALTIPAGQTASAGVVTVTPIDNAQIHPDRTVVYGIASAPKHKVASPGTAVVTIADDDRLRPAGGADQPPPGRGGDPGGPDNGDGTTHDPTDPGQPDEDAEPEAWVDVSLGYYGWWWDSSWNRNPDEQSYGSTADGPGLTTGGVLRLNDDFDESENHTGTEPPSADLAKSGIVPGDDELGVVWLGAWADDTTEEAADDGTWTLTWDESKALVWSPEYDADDVFTGFVQRGSGWTGTLADLRGGPGGYWWSGWGLGALVEPILASGSVDDLSFVASLSPAEGDVVEDTAKATVYDVDLDVDSDNSAGFDPPEGSEAEEWAEDRADDPGKILAVNDDDTDDDGVIDFADFDGITPDEGEVERFVPVVVTLPPTVDTSDAKLQFSYAGSDPAAMGRTGDGTPEDPYVYTPAAGRARLWLADGDAPRNPAGIEDDGQYITPGEPYTLAELGISSSGAATFWLEAVAPSQSAGDAWINLSLSLDGTYFGLGDAVQATAFRYDVLYASAEEVDLGWDAITGASSYRIKRATAGAPEDFQEVATVGDAEELFTDTTVTNTTEYLYQIEPVFSDDESASVAPVAAITSPLVPIDLDAHLAGNSLTLTWRRDPQAQRAPDEYRILRYADAAGPGFDVVGTVGGGTTAFTDGGLPPDSWFDYAVEAVYKDVGSGFGDVATVYTAPAAPPTAPDNLQLDTAAGDSIALAWADTSANEKYFRIERAPYGSSGFVPVALVGADSTGFTDTEVTAGSSYTYRVVAVNAAGESAASAAATADAPAGAQPGRFGQVPPAVYDSGPVVLGVEVKQRYSDRERAVWIRSGGINFSANMETAIALVNDEGYATTISVVAAPDGRHGMFHVWKNGTMTGQYFLGTITFNAMALDDMHSKFQAAKAASDLGTINTAAATVREVGGVGVQTAAMLIPGPQEAIIAGIVTKIVQKFGAQAVKVSVEGGKWVFKRAGQLLTKADDLAAANRELREAVKKEFGGDAIAWMSSKKEYYKHVPPKKPWDEILESTANGRPAKYHPSIDIEIYERAVWTNGTALQHKGGKWKVMEFDKVIGASNGKPSKWMRVESTPHSAGVGIHGHPIPEEMYNKLLKKG